MTFEELHIVPPILKALDEQGYTEPTPIQEQSIPILLRNSDLLGCAQTGTGKTAAFSIPIIQQLYLDGAQDTGKRKVRALIVTPTRELALQIGENFTTYGKNTGLRNTVIFGGVKQGAQTQALRKGVDALIATPGRLLDLMNQGYISLKDVEYFVLDEADQMLDMGFIHDIRKLLAKLPDKRQSLFFSATMSRDIVDLSNRILGNPEKVTIEPKKTTAERVEMGVYYVSKKNKPHLLIDLLEKREDRSVLVFSRTKHGSDKVVKILRNADITAEAIHGNKSQNARVKALNNFKAGTTRVLVATDIAARGIDVSDLSLVLNYDLPNVPETYVHRIGRTGRAKASGVALSFCDGEEREYLRDIQKLIDQKIPIIEDQPYPDDGTFVPTPKKNNANNSRGGRRSGQGRAQGKPKSEGSRGGNDRRSGSGEGEGAAKNKKKRPFFRKRND